MDEVLYKKRIYLYQVTFQLVRVKHQPRQQYLLFHHQLHYHDFLIAKPSIWQLDVELTFFQGQQPHHWLLLLLDQVILKVYQVLLDLRMILMLKQLILRLKYFSKVKSIITLMASIPLILVLVSCSLNTMKGLPYSSYAKLICKFKKI